MDLATNHFAHNLNLQVCIARVIGLILVILFLRHYLCWALTGIPLVYPVVTLCCGDIAVFGLQDKSLHVLPQINMGVDVGSWAWVVSGMVNPPALPWHHKGELSIVAGLVHLCSNEQGTGLVLLLSHLQDRLSHLDHQGDLYCVAQTRCRETLSQVLLLVLGKNSSPASMTSRGSLLPS